MGFSISEYLDFTDEEIQEMAQKRYIKIPAVKKDRPNIKEDPKLRDFEQHREQIIKC